jgi:hypothetical protein
MMLRYHNSFHKSRTLVVL